MSIPLRPAARYARLEHKRERLGQMQVDLDEAVRTKLLPALFEFESYWLSPAEREDLSPARLEELVLQLLVWARTASQLEEAHLLELHRLLAPGVGSYRTQPVPVWTPSHQPLPPAQVARAIERFFEWATSPAFEEMHAVEQMSIAQARLLEIHPFPQYTRLTVTFFAQYFLLRQSHPIALYSDGQQQNFDEALDQAFQFSTQPLVEWNLSACERAYASLMAAVSG